MDQDTKYSIYLLEKEKGVESVQWAVAAQLRDELGKNVIPRPQAPENKQ